MKIKKTILITLVFLIGLLGTGFTVFASECSPLEEDLLPDSSDYEEIAALESTILSELRSVGCTGVDSINFSDAIKVYTGTDIFELGTNDRDTLLDALQSGSYFWLIFVTDEDVNYKVTLSVGQPLSENAADLLTENEKQRITENEGKWYVSGISEDTGTDYRTQLSENTEMTSYGTDYVIISDLSGLQRPIVLLFDSDKAVGFVKLDFSYSILEEDSGTDIPSPTLFSDSTTVYDFASVSEASLSYATLYDTDDFIAGAASETANTDSAASATANTDSAASTTANTNSDSSNAVMLSGLQLLSIAVLSIIALAAVAIFLRKSTFVAKPHHYDKTTEEKKL